MDLSEDDILFLNKYKDLKKLLDSTDKYDTLKMSAILRQLLIDEYPLIHRVNKKWKIKIRYKIYSSPFVDPDDPNITLWFRGTGLYPQEDSEPEYIYEINQDNFLSTRICKFKGEFITVKDIIKFASNVLGAVHRRDPDPKKRHEIAINLLRRFVKINNIELPLYQLKPIANITLKGLNVLHNEIESAQ